MVFCNRCGNEAGTLNRTPILEMSLCNECRDTFTAWITRQVQVADETQSQENLMLHQSNRELENENFELKAKLKELEKGDTVTQIKAVTSVAHAKQVMQEEGYICYKKPENWGKWNKGKHTKRNRRTKAEIEQDRQRGVEQ